MEKQTKRNEARNRLGGIDRSVSMLRKNLTTLVLTAVVAMPLIAQSPTKEGSARKERIETISTDTPFEIVNGIKIYNLGVKPKIDFNGIISPCDNNTKMPNAPGIYHCLIIPRENAEQKAEDTSNVSSSTYTQIWSGYVSNSIGTTSPLFNSIQGSWIMPSPLLVSHAVNRKGGNNDNSIPLRGDINSSQWIGIGGYGDPTLVQTGTSISPYDYDQKGLNYYAWYELFPASAIAIQNFLISPGDVINSSIVAVPNIQDMWKIQLLDITKGEGFNLTVSYQSNQQTAEWILERPTACTNGIVSQSTCYPMQLLDTNTLYFGNDFISSGMQKMPANVANGMPIGSLPNLVSLRMTEQQDANSPTIAMPSALSSDGSSFSITTYAIPASEETTQ